jgi:hypothetical protein
MTKGFLKRRVIRNCYSQNQIRISAFFQYCITVCVVSIDGVKTEHKRSSRLIPKALR